MFALCLRLRKRENSSLRVSVTFPPYLSQQISAVVRFRHVSANGFAVVCYIYQNTNARWFFENQLILTSRRRTTAAAAGSTSPHNKKMQMFLSGCDLSRFEAG